MYIGFRWGEKYFLPVTYNHKENVWSGDQKIIMNGAHRNYGYSNQKALQVLKILSHEQIDYIKQRLEIGGKK